MNKAIIVIGIFLIIIAFSVGYHVKPDNSEEIQNLQNQITRLQEQNSQMQEENKQLQIQISEFLDKIEFYYTVSKSKCDKEDEQFNEIIIDKNNVLIHRNFGKSSPCSNVDYKLVKENFTISIIPENIPDESGVGCIAILGCDAVKINLILGKGEYILNFYSSWNYNTPEFVETIIIE